MDAFATRDIDGHRWLSRREFLRLSVLTSAGLIVGCAINPVTGEKQLMLVSEDWEVQVDQQNSPHQFSTDYGPVQDEALNRYLQLVGSQMTAQSHRPQMPYSFRCVNATYINAYAFPGGSIATTRGILLSLENEAELAALLGHELGHVNARHTARQMSKSMLTEAIVGGVSAFAGAKGEAYGQVAAMIGMLGSGALLAKYSRDNEREADYLGMTYMTRGGYATEGFVELMAMLKSLSHGRGDAVSLLFATHPMSEERYQTALKLADTEFSGARAKAIHRERYMDNTAALRKIKPAIELFQKGDEALAAGQFDAAEAALNQGLKLAPADYAGLVIMSKCQMAQKKFGPSLTFAEQARQAYPQEAQADYLSGFAHLQLNKPEAAVADFTSYEKKLPGNPNTRFYRGYAYEGMSKKQNAAEDYVAFLKQVNQGEQAQYAYQRLVEWGVVKPAQATQ